MEDAQFQILNQKMDRILELLEKKKKPRQAKIPDNRSLQELIEPYKNQYPPSFIEDFILYWTAKNPNGTKERWQMERVFDVGKRLITRKRQLAKWDFENSQKRALKNVEEMPQRQSEERVNTGFNQLGNLFNQYGQ